MYKIKGIRYFYLKWTVLEVVWWHQLLPITIKMYWEYHFSLGFSEQEERNWLKVHCFITFICKVFYHRFLLGQIIAGTHFYILICGPLNSRGTWLTPDLVNQVYIPHLIFTLYINGFKISFQKILKLNIF